MPNAWWTLKAGSKVLHTFPVTICGSAEDHAFKEKALEAAGNAKLVPNHELGGLDAKMHVSRGGQLTPFGDPHGVLAETKAGLTRSFASVPICSGSKRAGRMNARTTSGIRHSVSAFANAPTRCGSGRAVRKASRTSIGFGRAPLRKVDGPPEQPLSFLVTDNGSSFSAVTTGRNCPWPHRPRVRRSRARRLR